MQLTIEVLPAPLGPIIENSSPSLTPKLTSVSARTPPKRSDTPRTSKACSTFPPSRARSAGGDRSEYALFNQGDWPRSCPAVRRSSPTRAAGQPVLGTLARQQVRLSRVFRSLIFNRLS